MEGYISASREAILRLTLRGADGSEIETDAALDTGFTAFLTLPPALVEELALPFVAAADAMLANGAIARFDVYRATVLWNGERRQVQAYAAEGGALVGMSLLYGNIVTIEVIDGGAVAVEPLE